MDPTPHSWSPSLPSPPTGPEGVSLLSGPPGQLSFEEETIGQARFGVNWCPPASLFAVPGARLGDQVALPKVTRAFPIPTWLRVLLGPAPAPFHFVQARARVCVHVCVHVCVCTCVCVRVCVCTSVCAVWASLSVSCPCCSFVCTFVSRQQRRRAACAPFSPSPSRDLSANRRH